MDRPDPAVWMEPASCIPNVLIDMRAIWNAISTKASGSVSVVKPYKRRFRKSVIKSDGFRESILDRLDKYMVYIQRLKKYDASTYDLYRSVGGTIAHFDKLLVNRLDDTWKKDRPAFGCLFFPGEFVREKESHMIGTPFGYFQKVVVKKDRVEPHVGDLYEVTLYWDKKDDKKLFKSNGFGITFYVDVLPNGDVKPLRSLQTRYVEHHSRQKINCTVGKKTRMKAVGIYKTPETYMGLPPAFGDVNWLNETSFDTAEDVAKFYFVILANAWKESEKSPWRVIAERRGVCASFRIGINNAPTFFKDRDLYVNENGRRKKVFHFVGEHKRVTMSGTESTVRAHFRGQRKFVWKDYDIVIAVEEYHHAPLSDLQEPFIIVEEDEDVTEDMIGADELGKYLHDVLVA